jgi:hypothetical protein
MWRPIFSALKIESHRAACFLFFQSQRGRFAGVTRKCPLRVEKWTSLGYFAAFRRHPLFLAANSLFWI